MTKVTFYKQTDVGDAQIKFVVIAARYQDQWVYCRHKERTTWEIPGGHREAGESIEEAARRELMEETGAVDAVLQMVAVYGVETGDSSEDPFDVHVNRPDGVLFFANIRELGDLSEESEIGEVQLFEIPPENQTYTGIQPYLYDHVQAWLNLRTNADELWDVYDENRNLTGKFHRRGDARVKGEYYLSVHVWMQNSRGEFLLTKRAPNKGFPNMWETTGGAALAGDDSLKAALREVKEETGLTADPEKGQCIISKKVGDGFLDVWFFRQDFDLNDVVLLPGETCDKMYASIEKIRKLHADGVFVPYSYLEQVLEFASGFGQPDSLYESDDLTGDNHGQ